MSDASQGPGWWLASDGKWYPPDQVPGPAAPAEPSAPAEQPVAAEPVVPTPAETPREPTGRHAGARRASTSGDGTPRRTAGRGRAAPGRPASHGAPLPGPPGPPPGAYAAAPVAGYTAPPPAKKGGSGCLKAFLIVAVIIVLFGIGLFVLLAFVVKKGVDTVNSDAKAEQKVEQRTGISSSPLGFNAKHPPQDDISTGSMQCNTDADGNMQATGTVTNHSSNTSTYTITISFRQNGAEVSTGGDILPSVGPGATATWTANSVTTPDGAFTCKVTDIERVDLGDFGVTTTTG